jgi:large subunit ribosomal protein L9
MKVILQHDIPKLGKTGDIKEVADGYARNYLIPRQLAVSAQGGALKQHAARMAAEQARMQKAIQTAQDEAEKMSNLKLTIVGKVGSGTKLFGSITAQHVSEEIRKATSITIDKRRIGLVDPIKSLGVYSIPVRLHNEVTVSVQLEVTTQEELDRRAAAEAAEAEKAAAIAAEQAAKAAASGEAVESTQAEAAE